MDIPYSNRTNKASSKWDNNRVGEWIKCIKSKHELRTESAELNLS